MRRYTMLNAPVPLFRKISALVLRRSSSMTASETEAVGMSTRVSAMTGGLSAGSSASGGGANTV